VCPNRACCLVSLFILEENGKLQIFNTPSADLGNTIYPNFSTPPYITMARCCCSSLILSLAASIWLLACPASAFGSFGGAKSSSTKIPLPTYDAASNRYTKNPQDDGAYPYDVIGSALRHGPSPFFTRLFNADEYEQGVLKYMYTQKVTRSEATGNVDAKLNNVVDGAFQKQAEKNGKPKVDYTVLDKKQAILTSVWALGITPLAVNVVLKTVSEFSNNPGPCAICN